jgi:hypothetical protein
MIAHGEDFLWLSGKWRMAGVVLMHLQPNFAQVDLNSIVLQLHFEINGFRVFRVQEQAPIVALLASRIDFYVNFTTVLDMSNQRVDKDGPRNSPKDDIPLGFPAKMNIVIKACMFDLLDHARAR